ncbi:MAG: hypothetical protein LUO93_07400, partial [Methanomicrobiales archaeon]|nr:hypothetical protein [Methanomicrobiales archaeon]
MKSRNVILVYGLLILLIVFSGCITQQSKSPPTSEITKSSKILLGSNIEVLSQSIPQEGGAISVNIP